MNTKRHVHYSHQLYSKLDHLIASTPMLSLEEEKVCALRDTDTARERLVLSHLRLVKSIAFRFTSSDVDVKDIFSQGIIGLLKAIDKYAPSKGRLATFARYHVLGEILCYLRKAQTPFFLPDPLRRSINRFSRVSRTLGAGATDAEIAAKMGCAVEQVSCFREYLSQHFEDLDAPLCNSDTEVLTLSDTIGSVDPGFAEVEAKLTVAQLLSKLLPVEGEVLRLHYGLSGSPLSLREIGVRFGKSHMWVSKIEKAALVKLRKHVNSNEVEA